MFHGHLVLVLKAVSRKVMRVLFALGFCLWVLVCLGFRGLGIFWGFFLFPKESKLLLSKDLENWKGLVLDTSELTLSLWNLRS